MATKYNSNMANFKLKDSYSDKSKFITDFVRSCRVLRLRGAMCVVEVVAVCEEQWVFEIHTKNNQVSTNAWLFDKTNPVEYPMTTWGGSYSRWDSELREFLQREVCKKKDKSLISYRGVCKRPKRGTVNFYDLT